MTAIPGLSVVAVALITVLVAHRGGALLARRRAASRLAPRAPSGAAPQSARRFRFRRRQPPPETQLAALVDAIARRCNSGDTLNAAFSDALTNQPAAVLFTEVRQSLAAGASLAEALRATPPGANEDLALVRHTLSLAAEHGGPIGEPLDRAASTLRGRQAIRDERRAQAAQARLSAKVLTLCPLAFSAWTAATTPSIRTFLAQPGGMVVIAVGLVLNATGWVWMNRIIGGQR